MGDAFFSYSQLDEITYTNQVIEEAMRLYPPACAIIRQAAKEEVIDGWRIKKDDNIIMSPYLAHQLSRY